MKKELKNYILGLLEFDLTSDLEYLTNDLIEKDVLASDDDLQYEWLDDEFQEMAINIINEDFKKTYKIKIDIEEE